MRHAEGTEQKKGVSKMLKKINAVNVCSTLSFIFLILFMGFACGYDIVGSLVCLALFAGFAFLTLKEDGQIKK